VKAQLRVLWKQFKWVFLALGAVIVVVVVFLLRSLVPRKKSNIIEGVVSVPIDERIMENVRVAEEEAVVARVEAKVRADADMEQLERISKVEDGVERRRQLAAMLRRL